MKRTALIRKTPLRKMGANKSRETAKYWPLRRKFIEDNPFCEVPTRVHDCTFRATTIHHMKGQHWKIMNDTRYWCAACINGHIWIEANKKEARKRGLILYK